MKQKTLSKRLKMILVGIAFLGLLACFWILPDYGQALVLDYPELSNRFWPWLIFFWLCALPCYSALFLGWKMASSIGEDRAFTQTNARYLKQISQLAYSDGLFFLAGNIVLFLMNFSHPGVLIFSLLVVFAAFAIAAAASALSYLVQKAALLQEQSDLTI